MLQRLINVHDELLARIAGLQSLCSDPAPQRLAVTGERWRISQLMGVRAKLVDDEVYPYLLRSLPVDDRLLIEQFRRDGLLLRTGLKQHLDEWSTDRVFDEWQMYVAVLPAIFRMANQRILDERYILYPLMRAQ